MFKSFRSSIHPTEDSSGVVVVSTAYDGSDTVCALSDILRLYPVHAQDSSLEDWDLLELNEDIVESSQQWAEAKQYPDVQFDENPQGFIGDPNWHASVIAENPRLLSWDFDAFKSMDTYVNTVVLCQKIFDVFDFPERIEGLQKNTLDTLLSRLIEAHPKNAYHNAKHAVYTLHFVAMCLVNLRMADNSPDVLSVPVWVSAPEAFGCLMASMVHALGNPGFTEFFLNTTREMPSGSSVLGTLKIADLSHEKFQKILKDIPALLAHMKIRDRRVFTSTVEYCCKAAAGSEHWDILRHLQLFCTTRADKATFAALSSRVQYRAARMWAEFLLKGIFRLAYLSKVCRSESVASEWIHYQGEEYLKQSIEEIHKGLPANSYSSHKSEILLGLDMVDFFTSPMIFAIEGFVIGIKQVVAQMHANRKTWENTLLTKYLHPHLAKSIDIRGRAFASAMAKLEKSLTPSEWEDAENPAILYSSANCLKRTRFVFLFLTDFLLLANERMKSATLIQLEFYEDIYIERNMGHQVPQSHYSDQAGNEGDDNQFRRVKTSFVTFMTLDNAIEFKEVVYDKVETVYHDLYYQAMMTLFTLWAVFGMDLQILFFSSSADPIFDALIETTILMFIIDICIKLIIEKPYRWSLYLVLDVLATLSLLFDISWVMAWLFDLATDQNDSSSSGLFPARVFISATRMSRILRLLRILQLFRIVKLYLYLRWYSNDTAASSRRLKSSKIAPRIPSGRFKMSNRSGFSAANSSASMASLTGNTSNSKLGLKFADLTTRRVVLIIFSMLIWNSLLLGFVIDSEAFYRSSAGFIHAAAVDAVVQNEPEYWNTTVRRYVSKYQEVGAISIGVLLERADVYNSIPDEIERLRIIEYQIVRASCTLTDDIRPLAYSEAERASMLCSYDNISPSYFNLSSYANYTASYDTYVMYNRETLVETEALINFVNTLFVLVLLAVSMYIFNRDARRLVITPVERMVYITEVLVANPLAQLDVDEEKGDEPVQRRKRRPAHGTNYYGTHATLIMQDERLAKSKSETDMDDVYETTLVENCLKKIGSLLRVGFGAGGAEIIACNMNGTGHIDPMMPGRNVEAIFAACHIRDFLPTLHVMGEEMTVYVNSIADIVHSKSRAYGGATIKNSGDSFLLVWKRPIGIDSNWTVVAERALISLLKMKVEILRNPDLAVYNRKDSKMGKRLRKNIPDFTICIASGLHKGWGIEGAVGSKYKVDAVYLSQDAHMAHQLENLNKSYGTDILFSSSVYRCLGEEAKKRCRMIDMVQFAGTNTLYGIYTFDTEIAGIEPKLQAISLENLDSHLSPQSQYALDDKKISLVGVTATHQRQLMQSNLEPDTGFGRDLEVCALQWEIPPQFAAIARKAVTAYLDGNWSIAKELVEAAFDIRPEERHGPCGYLYGIMKKKNFVSPPEWNGIRRLD